MNKKLLKGVQVINGTVDDFTLSGLTDDIIYFVRTKEDNSDGYIYFNNKKYGAGSDAKVDSNYIKNYNTVAEYEADTTRQTPNVCYIEETDELIYNN